MYILSALNVIMFLLYAGLSESFKVKVSLHQGSALSPLLFAALMDVVSSGV